MPSFPPGHASDPDVADRDVHSLPLETPAFLQHFVRLADARRETEIDLEPAALLALDQAQEMLGDGFFFFGGHGGVIRAWFS